MCITDCYTCSWPEFEQHLHIFVCVAGSVITSIGWLVVLLIMWLFLEANCYNKVVVGHLAVHPFVGTRTCNFIFCQ